MNLPSYLEAGRGRRRGRRRRRATFASRRPRRRSPITTTGLVILLGAAAGIAGGVVLVRNMRANEGRSVVERFAAAWERQDYTAMYRLVDPTRGAKLDARAFRDSYRRTAAAATATGVSTGRPRRSDDGWLLPVRVRTKIFGTVAGSVRVRLSHGDEPRVRWTPELTFPGLSGSLVLRRHTRAPRRAALLARDGHELAGGDGQPTELGAQSGIAGELGEPDAARRRQLAAEGFAPGTRVGVSGLQKLLDGRLRGRPGGTLTVGGRVLARSRPVRAPAVRTSLDPRLQRAAQAALGGRYGGVAAIEPATGEVLAVAGIAVDGAQPPGSTFKIMTVTAAFEAGLVNLHSRFPVRTGANVGGRFLANAHDEACGGDLTESFSKSCNSVFAPLGVKLGARRLVDVAERFGFNQPPGVPGAKPDTIPAAGEMTPVEVGSAAIGQGRVLATALGMARVGAVIANGGRRPQLTLLHGEPPRLVRVTTPRVAGLVRELMFAVVNGDEGTGTAAAIKGGKVAGKTGTAELGGDQENDAWFVAFAPAPRPRIAVGVLVVHGGFGGDTAAPIAREVLAAGLENPPGEERAA